MTKRVTETTRHFGQDFDLRGRCLSLGFSAPITDPTAATRGGRRPQSLLPALSLCLSLPLYSSHSQGWSLSLRREQDSVNEAVAVESRGRRPGREGTGRRRGGARC